MLVRLSTAISTAMGCGISRYGAADPLGTGDGFRKKFGQLQIRNDPSVVVTASSDRSTVPLLNEGASRDHDLSRPHAKLKAKRKRKGKRHNNNNNNNNNNNSDDNAIEVDDDNEDRMTNGSKNEIQVVAQERGGHNNDYDDEEYSDQVDDHDQDQGKISDFEGIGSPSFREYCHCNVDHCDSDGCCKEAGSGTTVDEEKGTTTINVYQGSVNNSKTMGSEKKGRKFIKVFPAGGSSSALAMKNFLHVTACYNPNSTN